MANIPKFSLGNLLGGTTINFSLREIRAGNFGGDAGTDLLVYDPFRFQLHVFIAITASNGTRSFVWAFTTNTGIANIAEELSVANIDGDETEDAIFHDVRTGEYRFLKVQYINATLPAIAQTSGQLYNGGGSSLFWSKLKTTDEEGNSNARDDALSYIPGPFWHRVDARFDGAEPTYWWIYTQYPLLPSEDQDGDAIRTVHELGGYDANGDGIIDEPLNMYGASPFTKDVFVEVDYMAKGPNDFESYIFKPEGASLAVNEFAKKNMNLHIFWIRKLLMHQR